MGKPDSEARRMAAARPETGCSRDARPERRAPILALLLANAVSVVGNAMAAVAIPWFVLQTTDSAARTGLTGAVGALGAVLAAFFGGPIVDRLGFKRTSVAADLMSAAMVALIPLLFAAGYLAFWLLLVLVFLGAVLDAPGLSARRAMIPELARIAGMPTEMANSADSAVPRLAQFVGPPLAGVLIAGFGALGVLWLDAATFVFSAALVATVVPSVRSPATDESADGRRGYLRELSEGLRFVWASPLLLSLVFLTTVGNFLDAPLQAVILPVYAEEVFGSAFALGGILGGFGAGALAGTLLFGAFGHRLPRRMTFLVCFVLVGPAAYLTLAMAPSLAVLVGVFAVLGVLAGPIEPISLTIFQERTPPEIRGRVLGATNALYFAAIPIGMALGGVVVEVAGLMPTLVGMGLVYLAVTLGMFFNPALREMDAVGNR